MPPIMYDIFDLLATLFRLLGLLVLGLGAGWFALEVFRKGQQAWQLQIAIFLGFAGLTIAMAYFLAPGALGAFAIGAGAAMLVWGMKKPKKEEEIKEE